MLLKNLLELCILQLLSLQDMYGYEILRRLHAALPETQESAIYAQLRSLCQQEYTQFYEGKTSGGPTRKYYQLTPKGKQRLGELMAEWRKYCDLMADLGVK